MLSDVNVHVLNMNNMVEQYVRHRCNATFERVAIQRLPEAASGSDSDKHAISIHFAQVFLVC